MGAALANRCFDLGWIVWMKHSSAVIVTSPGRRGFRETFGIGAQEETRDIRAARTLNSMHDVPKAVAAF